MPTLFRSSLGLLVSLVLLVSPLVSAGAARAGTAVAGTKPSSEAKRPAASAKAEKARKDASKPSPVPAKVPLPAKPQAPAKPQPPAKVPARSKKPEALPAVPKSKPSLTEAAFTPKSKPSLTEAASTLKSKPQPPSVASLPNPVALVTPAPKPVPPPRPVFAAGELQRLGSLSVGKPNTGYLVNAVPMPSHPDWVLSVPDHRFGTAESVNQLQHCLHQVHAEFPGSPRVVLGSLSAQFGGSLPPHKSHRTGRDVDVYFFRKLDAQWNRNAKREDIDLPRTWALLKCFVSETDVDMVLVDHVVQGWLEAYALSIDEPSDWVHGLFHDQAHGCCAPVRHVPGHGAHMHVRFSSPNARQRAVQSYDRLVAAGIVPRKVAPVQYSVIKGDTLIGIARRYHVTVDALRANNTLGGKVLRLGQVVTIQQAVDIEGAKDAVWVPPRHVASNHSGPGLDELRRSLAAASVTATAFSSQRVLAAEELGVEDESSVQGAEPSEVAPANPAPNPPVSKPKPLGPTAQRDPQTASLIALQSATRK